MLGLKKRESSKFEKFFGIVQETAQKAGCVFFLDAGDGNDFETEDLEGEDLMGWLIPEDKVSEFTLVWKEDSITDDWTEFFVWAVWNNEQNPTIKFEE